MEKDIKILAIESSCDETAAAVVVNGREVLSNIIACTIISYKERYLSEWVLKVYKSLK